MSRYRGVLLGTALGDALGLPYEGLPPARAVRLLRGELRPRFIGGRAMCSDDTEHTLMVAQSLLAHPDDAGAFARSLAWRLRFWLLGLPAGVGFATLRSAMKLWMGFPPSRSGVWSAGNGPAMRAAVIGVCLGADDERLRAYVRASTRLTHTDPRAERAALAIALAAHRGREGVIDSIASATDDDLAVRVRSPYTPAPKGVTGFAYDSVPAAISAWLAHPNDFRAVIETCVAWGGDTDTVGAMAGALAGAEGGETSLPADWLAALWEWPCTVDWMRALGDRLEQTFAHGMRPGPLPLAWPLIVPRNALFMATVLGHGARRLLPRW